MVYLEDGRIADRGTHAELLARSPAYAHLVNAYEQHARAGRDVSTHDRATERTSGTRMDTGEDIARAWRRSAAASATRPSSSEGIGGTLLLAVVASLGQVVVPIAVQQTLDRGLQRPRRPRRRASPC